MAAEVRPRSVNDVKVLREEASGQASKRFKHKYAAETFRPGIAPPDWDILHVHGPTGVGKTKWAVAQFKNPLLIKPFKCVGGLEKIKRQFDPKMHDGIVCDEANLRFMSREEVRIMNVPNVPTTVIVTLYFVSSHASHI